MKNNVQQRGVNFQVSVVTDKALFRILFMKKLTRDRVVPIFPREFPDLSLPALVQAYLPCEIGKQQKNSG